MKRASNRWMVISLALLPLLLISSNSEARSLEKLKESQELAKRHAENLASRSAPELGPSRCAGGVTLLGISSATPGTALGKLREDDELNQDMQTLLTTWGEPLSRRSQYSNEVQRLDERLEKLGERIARERSAIRSMSNKGPAYAQALADLKALRAQYSAYAQKREEVAWQLESTEMELSEYYRKESAYLQQAREVAERYGCS